LRFIETSVPGAYIVELERIGDERGWFARTFDAQEFRELGMDSAVVQCNVSYNERAGTLRGMHYQAAPHSEPKLVRCTRGAIFDVVVDLRPASSARGQWFGTELTPDNGRSLFIPVEVAHGFQTLTDRTDVHYQMGHVHVPEAARGVRWNDPAFGIDWPSVPGERIVSESDRSYPDFKL
jgi:dTDP-4-dehydrorhamnose 3,5-epimerase